MSSEPTSDEMGEIVVNIYPDAFSAELAKGALDSAGIPCYIRSEAVSGVYPLWIQQGFGPELVVRSKDYAVACAILGIAKRP